MLKLLLVIPITLLAMALFAVLAYLSIFVSAIWLIVLFILVIIYRPLIIWLLEPDIIFT